MIFSLSVPFYRREAALRFVRRVDGREVPVPSRRGPLHDGKRQGPSRESSLRRAKSLLLRWVDTALSDFFMHRQIKKVRYSVEGGKVVRTEVGVTWHAMEKLAWGLTFRMSYWPGARRQGA